MKLYNGILVIALVVTLISCREKVQDEDDLTEKTAEELMENIKKGDFEIITIDKCEYLVYSRAKAFGFMAHKGNCKNPIHVYNELPNDAVNQGQ